MVLVPELPPPEEPELLPGLPTPDGPELFAEWPLPDEGAPVPELPPAEEPELLPGLPPPDGPESFPEWPLPDEGAPVPEPPLPDEEKLSSQHSKNQVATDRITINVFFLTNAKIGYFRLRLIYSFLQSCPRFACNDWFVAPP